MKKRSSRSLLYYFGGIVACGLVSGTARASVEIYEPFDYPAGQAVTGSVDTYYAPGNGTWNQTGTATTPVHQAIAGSLTAPSGFPTTNGNAAKMLNGDNTEYNRMNLSQQYGTNAVLYYSLLVNVPSISGLTTAHTNANANNDGIIAFNNNAGASGTRPNTWAGELTIRLGNTAGTYNLGIRASTTVANTTYWSGDLNPGDTHLVISRWTEGATAGTGGLSEMWLDPSSATFGAAEGSVPAADGSTVGTFSASGTADHTNSVIIGAGIAAGATPSTTNIDEIRVGTTWSDVTTATFLPEPASLGFIAMAGAGMLIRRKRA